MYFFFYGIKFYVINFKIYCLKSSTISGYVVAPAASSLSTILYNKKYLLSLRRATYDILDSGFFCILIRCFKKNLKIKKFSGFLFLKNFLNKNNKNHKILLINPSIKSGKTNVRYLQKKGFLKTKSYIAPMYKFNNYKDFKLFSIIKNYKPNYIIVNIGGEIQEPLANEIYINFKNQFKINIICTGAAIGFLTGQDAKINYTIDKFYLGWLFRFFSDPKKYYKRIFASLRLISLFE